MSTTTTTTTSSTGTNKSTAILHNPTDLPPRFEIRQLNASHIDWATAIVVHSNIFHSSIWPLIYPENKTARAYDSFEKMEYLVRHQIDSGMSYGVFDTAYIFKNPSSVPDGKLYWNPQTHPNATPEQLLEQMDFPLVSIALAYDQNNPLDIHKLLPLMDVIPRFATLFQVLMKLDKRDSASWTATGPNQVLLRNATSTRRDYEGQGLMKKLAHFLMRQAKMQGYRASQIDCTADAVSHVWLNPPAPFKAELIAKVDMASYEEKNEEGEMVKVFEPSRQVCTRVFVTL